eukprot:6839355-Prymnesium_polylepis.1
MAGVVRAAQAGEDKAACQTTPLHAHQAPHWSASDPSLAARRLRAPRGDVHPRTHRSLVRRACSAMFVS